MLGLKCKKFISAVLIGVGMFYMANIAHGGDWGIEQESKLQQSQSQLRNKKTDLKLYLEQKGIDLNNYSKSFLYMKVPEEGEDSSSTSALVLYKNKKGDGLFIMYHFDRQGFDENKEKIQAFDFPDNGLVGLIDKNGKTGEGIDKIFVTRMNFQPAACIGREVSKDDPLYQEAYKKLLEIYTHLGDKSRNILADNELGVSSKR